MPEKNSKKGLQITSNIMRDFKRFTGDPKPTVNLSTNNFDPPSYIIQILLLGVLEMQNYGATEKVWWHTYFEYKNQIFMVRDYKFGSWSIEGENKQNDTIVKAKEIHKKICEASKHLDRILQKDLQDNVKQGNFYLNNAYLKLFRFYEFYKKQVEDAIIANELEQKKVAQIKATAKPKSTSLKDLGEYLQKILNTGRTKEPEITYFLYGLMTIFLSLTEFLFEALYAFERPNLTKEEFKEKRWYEKYRIFFPLNLDKTIAKLYGSFIDIKRNFRNPLTHGLSDEAGILVPVPYVGLIPLSFEYLSTKLNYQDVYVKPEKAKEVIQTCDEFLKYLRTKDPYRYYLHYLENDLPIPMKKSEIKKIKKEMSSYNNFKTYIDRTIQYQDAVMNRDI